MELRKHALCPLCNGESNIYSRVIYFIANAFRPRLEVTMLGDGSRPNRRGTTYMLLCWVFAARRGWIDHDSTRVDIYEALTGNRHKRSLQSMIDASNNH